MSQLTITLSDKADALIAQLQKEIFNRRRKKVTAAGVIETLVESGAKSQSDKRFATSWSNLVADIEKAARVAHAHGAKPANLSDEEWALVLSHRTRAVAPAASSRRSAGRTRGAAVRRGANANRVEPIATDADASSSDSAAKVSRSGSTQPSKPARTTRKPSSSAAKESAKTRATKPKVTKPKVTKPKAAQSKASASQPTSTVAKATPQTTGDSPTSEGTAIPATAAAATPTKNRRRASSTTNPAPRSRSARVSAATRMAKAVSRLGATTNPAPVAEPPPVPLAVSANGSSPTPPVLA
jgi:hypothetical protein